VLNFCGSAVTVKLLLEHLRLRLAGNLWMFEHIRRAKDGVELSYREMLELSVIYCT
jgi:hypothetical protein